MTGRVVLERKRQRQITNLTMHSFYSIMSSL